MAATLLQRFPPTEGVVYFGLNALTDATAQVVATTLAEVPEICRKPLTWQASQMYLLVRKFLVQLGRPEREIGMRISGVDLNALAQPAYSCGDFSLTPQEIRDLANKAEVTYAHGRLQPAELFQFRDGPIPDEAQHLAQLMALTGPVYVMFNADFKSQPRPPRTLTVVSIPGINFAYSKADREAFTKAEDAGGATAYARRRVINEEAAIQRMKEIMHLAFLAFQRAGVEYPCLNAIGCGAFKGNYKEVPQLWARAVCELLQAKPYSFRAIFYSLPTFGDNNFSVFRAEFEKATALRTCVVMLENRGMVCIGDSLAKQGQRAGILNPSDVQAVRQGYLGMYWDGGHTALEEILAMQTTLLLHHRGINRALYEDESRRVPVQLDV